MRVLADDANHDDRADNHVGRAAPGDDDHHDAVAANYAVTMKPPN
jgi:hypothetical protein